MLARARACVRDGQGKTVGVRREGEKRWRENHTASEFSSSTRRKTERDVGLRLSHCLRVTRSDPREQTPGLRPPLLRLDPERVAERIRAETRQKSGGIMVFLCSSSSPVLQRCLTAADPIKARARIDLQPLLTSMQMSRTRPIRGERSRPGRSARVAAALKRTLGFDVIFTQDLSVLLFFVLIFILCTKTKTFTHLCGVQKETFTEEQTHVVCIHKLFSLHNENTSQ